MGLIFFVRLAIKLLNLARKRLMEKEKEVKKKRKRRKRGQKGVKKRGQVWS